MSLVLLPCHRCWAETSGVDHTQQDCDAQMAANERAREEAAKSNAAWKAKLAAMTPEERANRPQIKLPAGRIVKPSEWTS